MDTPKGTGELSRYGRKRKLTNDYKALVNDNKTDEFFSTPLPIPINVNLKRPTRKRIAEAAASSSSLDSAIETPKSHIAKRRKLAGRRKKRCTKKPKIRTLTKVLNEVQFSEDDDNDEFISEQLLKISMNEPPELPIFELEDIIDPDNFQPAKKFEKVKFKVPVLKLPSDSDNSD